ncbi:Disks large-associated protein 5 [Acanthosepion pharaonis]|uniref:Disks large-associated protein 5 n=1 Tax=Acanthosepion pharaonis TaxID=158019 RepID=A0A812EFF1_ACAPH|nr:Disks large-associated protein 5 [Sepia pharaonis]
MASSHIGAYKNLNRIDPRVRRRLRRSEEWQHKRDEEVNKRRNIELMSPCRELDVDLSMNSSVLETSSITPPPKSAIVVEDNKTRKVQQHPSPKLRRNKNQEKAETKSQKNTKSTEASAERLKMLQKWKRERDLLKKQEALEKAKHKPFIVSVTYAATQKTNFERRWEQEQKKQKIAKKHNVASEVPPARTRTGTASVASTTLRSQRVTRQTTAAAKQVAAPAIRAQATKAVPASRTAPVTRTTKTVSVPKPGAPAKVTSTRAAALVKSQPAAPAKVTSTRAAALVKSQPAAPAKVNSTRAAALVKSQPAALKKAPSKITETQSVRRSTRATAKSVAKTYPSTTINTRNHPQNVDCKQTELEAEQFEKLCEEDSVPEPTNESQCNLSKKSVSFVPDNFVFTGCVGLKSFDSSPLNRTILSPTSTRNFFSVDVPVNKFQSSNSPQMNFMTIRAGGFFNDRVETSASIETCDAVQEHPKDSNVGELSSKNSEKSSDCPSPDKNTDVSNETPERNGIPEAEFLEKKNVSVTKQELAIPTEELLETKSSVKPISPIRMTNKELFKTPVSQGPRTKRMRRSLSETRFDKEKSDKGNRKRRRTEMTRSPQTPEEWVELLKNSPMIEMSRRKIPKEKLNAVPLNLEFSDEDLAAANIILLKDSSNEVGEKPPESTPQKEMETSEKPVALASAVENEEVASEVSPLMSCDMQSGQTAANTENKTFEVATEIPSITVKHDVAYFRNLVKSQTDTLNSLADEFEAVIPNVSEEVEGQIRTVIGQTKLLISKRFRQFIGLIDNCEYNLGEKETTCDDLQGFWDMVDFQVEDVRIKFEELKKLRENGWQLLKNKPPVAKKLVKKTVKKAKPLAANTKKQKGKSEFALFMAQKKKEAKEQMKVSSNVSKPELEPSLKVFDGLFFKVESPVKSPKPHCEEISRSPLVIPTFVETDRTVRLSPTITTINIVENGETSKMDSPKMAVCPEKESPKVELKLPLSANSSSSTSPLIPNKSLRRSFVPAIPSPLLQDITPNQRNRRSHKSFVFSGVNSPRTPVQIAEQNSEAETDKEPAEKILVLQTPPLRRSGRLRSAASSPSAIQTPTHELVMQSFIKNMLSSESSSEESQTSKDEKSSTHSPDPAPVFTPLTDVMDNENLTLRRRSRGRKTMESQIINTSQKRRRSSRLSRKSISSYEELTTSDGKENAALLSIQIDLPPPSKDGNLKRRNRRKKSVAFSDPVSTVTVATGLDPVFLYTPLTNSKICEVEPDANLIAFSPS